MIETALGVALGLALFIGAVAFAIAWLSGAFDYRTNRIRREQARRIEQARFEQWYRNRHKGEVQ